MSKKSPANTVGPWQVNHSRRVFDNPWISLVDHDVVHPNGGAGKYGVVKFKNQAVGVLPVLKTGEVLLVGQHRFPLDIYSWELPEGGGPLHEDPLDAAKRELAEETGYTARNWMPLAEFDVSNSVTDEKAACYLAWEMTPGEARPEASEVLAVRKISFSALLEEVMQGRVRDSLTVVMCLTAHIKALRHELPEAISRLLSD